MTFGFEAGNVHAGIALHVRPYATQTLQLESTAQTFSRALCAPPIHLIILCTAHNVLEQTLTCS